MPTVSILRTLATLPSGALGPELALDELGQYLAKHCNDDAAKERERQHALRDELYRDGGTSHMYSLIDRTFDDPRTRELRKRWVPYARFANPTKRIVNQVSVVYAEPAERVVDGAADTANLVAVYEAIRADERMLEASRLLNLHRAIALGFRVRKLPSGELEPVLDVATPANARPVLHPNDGALVVGWLIRTSYRTARAPNDAAWTLWTDHEVMQLREDFSPIGDTYKEHGLGVCPWFGVSLGAPAPGFFGTGSEGSDLPAAHLAIWFSHVLLLKESKSATKQATMTGDATLTARGQASDTEIPSELPEGTSVQTHDLAMDLGMFESVTDHVLMHAALNHEIPPAVLTHQGTQSAEARDLMRLPIKEIRKQQVITWRRAERTLAFVISAVIAVDMPALRFDPRTFRVRFIEAETPLDPEKEHRLFLERRAAGLDNSIDMYKRLHAGVTDAQAEAAIERSYQIEHDRNEMMRPLQAISGSLGASTPNTTPPPARTAATQAEGNNEHGTEAG